MYGNPPDISMKTPTIAWSEFSMKKDREKFKGTVLELLMLVHDNWNNRTPGMNRKDLTEVVIVPIDDVSKFTCNWMNIQDAQRITGRVVRREDFEDPFVTLKGTLKKGVSYNDATFAKVVLYSAATLEQDNGHRSSDADWEIVAVLTGPWKDEPMTPLTMARNMLRKPGGTYVKYTAKQFAESIYFWSQFIQSR